VEEQHLSQEISSLDSGKKRLFTHKKVEGNISIAWGTAVFVAGIIFAKTIATDAIVPVF